MREQLAIAFDAGAQHEEARIRARVRDFARREMIKAEGMPDVYQYRRMIERMVRGAFPDMLGEHETLSTMNGQVLVSETRTREF